MFCFHRFSSLLAKPFGFVQQVVCSPWVLHSSVFRVRDFRHRKRDPSCCPFLVFFLFQHLCLPDSDPCSLVCLSQSLAVTAWKCIFCPSFHLLQLVRLVTVGQALVLSFCFLLPTQSFLFSGESCRHGLLAFLPLVQHGPHLMYGWGTPSFSLVPCVFPSRTKMLSGVAVREHGKFIPSLFIPWAHLQTDPWIFLFV